MTGDDTFADVMTANAAYASTFTLRGLNARAARGLAVVTCMDSRIDPLAILGLASGDSKIMRNAGGRVTQDVLVTLVVARYLLGVERLMVIEHTGCRMVAADENELPAAIRAAGGPDTSGLPIVTTPDQEGAVRSDVELARSFEPLSGLHVGGFIYDVDTGALSRVC